MTTHRVVTIESGGLDTEEQLQVLIWNMYNFPEPDYSYYHVYKSPLPSALKDQNAVIYDHVELHYYKYPPVPRCYFEYNPSDGSTQPDWKREIVEQGPMYVRVPLILAKWKQRQLENEQKIEAEKAANAELRHRRRIDISSLNDPILPEEDYFRILSILSVMSVAFERTPATFVGLQEENIRDIFLVLLNSHCEGQVTGETFNMTGKTDILIRVDNVNVFIAECKFWQGKAALIEAVNQLLGYCTWRDTKTALILFNRNRNMTSVLKTIEDAMPKHPGFVRFVEQAGETAFRYAMQLPVDASRHVIMTIMVFNVP